jgi:energy-coupling factor transporter transmembrane protein EcfT
MHPFVRIVCLMAFAVALQLAHPLELLAVGGVLLASLPWSGGAATFIKLMRRARWLLLSLLLIYAYATPGEYLSAVPEAWAPTWEGLQSGLLQAGRLTAMLAALAILLARSTREEIMVGIYLLLQPLRVLGVSPERFAVRLWLTLHYVETMPDGVIHRLRQHGWKLDDGLHVADEQPEAMCLQFPPIHLVDYLVLLSLPVWFWMLT